MFYMEIRKKEEKEQAICSDKMRKKRTRQLRVLRKEIMVIMVAGNPFTSELVVYG